MISCSMAPPVGRRDISLFGAALSPIKRKDHVKNHCSYNTDCCCDNRFFDCAAPQNYQSADKNDQF